MTCNVRCFKPWEQRTVQLLQLVPWVGGCWASWPAVVAYACWREVEAADDALERIVRDLGFEHCACFVDGELLAHAAVQSDIHSSTVAPHSAASLRSAL